MSTNIHKNDVLGNFSPNFDRDIYFNLPSHFNFLKWIGDDQDRSIAFIAALSGVSACLPNYFSFFREEKTFPPHYIYVVGEPGCGKSNLNYASKITRLVNSYIFDASQMAKKDWEGEPEDTRGAKPLTHLLKAAENTTKAAFNQQLALQGSRANLIVSTEADMLIQSMGGDHGGFKGELLKCFDQDELSISRKTDDVSYSILNPKLSVALASTKSTFNTFFSGAINDGFMSRFSFFLAKKNKDNKYSCRVSSRKSICAETKLGAMRVLGAFKALEKRQNLQVGFELTDSQVDRWDSFFSELIKKFNSRHSQARATVERLSITLYRQLMTLSILRHFDNKRHVDEDGMDEEVLGEVNTIYPSQEDIYVVLQMAGTYIYHLDTLFTAMPSTVDTFLAPKEALDSLPKVFKASSFTELLIGGGVSFRTANRRLAHFLNIGLIKKAEKQGWYVKNLAKKINIIHDLKQDKNDSPTN